METSKQDPRPPSSPAMVDLNEHALVALNLPFKVFTFIIHASNKIK